jgi:hypothetical protein
VSQGAALHVVPEIIITCLASKRQSYSLHNHDRASLRPDSPPPPSLLAGCLTTQTWPCSACAHTTRVSICLLV